MVLACTMIGEITGALVSRPKLPICVQA